MTTTLDLWQHIYGEQHGLIALFRGRRVDGEKELQDVQSAYFDWPSSATQATNWLQRQASDGHETYNCGHLVSVRKRKKETAVEMIACYVDGDGAQPPADIQPTAIVQSSPGREQFYWRLTRAIPAKQAEQLNRRLAHAMKADMSGWDLTQLLRPPDMPNFKYAGGPRVQLVEVRDAAWNPDELDRILPALPEKPRRETVTTNTTTGAGPRPLSTYAQDVWRGLRPKLKEDGSVDRSASLLHIGRVLYDAGAERSDLVRDLEERDSTLGWNKYTGRDDASDQYHAIVDVLEQQGRTPSFRASNNGPSTPVADLEPVDPNEDKDTTIARLQRELAKEKELTAAQLRTINTERTKREDLRATLDGMIGVLKNPNMEPLEKVSALLVVIPMAGANSHLEDPNEPDERPIFLGYDAILLDEAKRKIYNDDGIVQKEHIPGLADQVGKGPSAVSKALKRLAWNDPDSEDNTTEVKPGIWEMRRVRKEILDPNTGELIPTEKTRLMVKMPGTIGEVLNTLATFTPERKPSAAGGLRTPCAHENGAKYKGYCRDCDALAEEWTTDSYGNVVEHREILFIKNDGIEPALYPPVDNGTEVSKNDGIAEPESEPAPIQQTLMNNAMMLLEWAEANGWPGLVIQYGANGQPFKQVGPGEESWRKFVARGTDDIHRALEAAGVGGTS